MKTRLLICLLIFLLSSITKNALAATTYTWTGSAGDGNWTTPNNWNQRSHYPGYTSTDIASFTSSNVTVTLSTTLSIATLQTPNYGTAGITITLSGAPTLTIAAISMAQPSSNTTALTFSGSGYVSTTGSMTFGYHAGFTVSSGVTFTQGGSVNFDYSSTQATITNNGTYNFLSGATLKLGDNTTFTNNGTVNATSATFNQPGQSTFNNTGTFTATSCTFSCTGQSTGINNSGSSANFTLNGGSVSMPSGNNYEHISNTSSATFTANNNATITLGSYQGYISNSATFNAGQSGSGCVITVSGQGYKLGSGNTSIYNTGIFNLGPTSVINLTGTTTSNPTIAYNNGGTFTLLSDATGSATIGQLGAGGSCQGLFNVQRYISAHRSYRVLSPQTNPVAYTAPTTYYSMDLSYLWYNPSVPSQFYGAYVAGPSASSGFPNTNARGNPVVYLYQESLMPGSGYNASFLSGNNIGISAVAGTGASPYYGTGSSATISTVTSLSASQGKNTNQDGVSGVKLPIGNGFLFYYIGNDQTSAQTGGTTTTCNVTSRGYINQGTIPVYTYGVTPSTTLTNTTGSRYPGLTMLGNPYPSTIDLNQFYQDNDQETYVVFDELYNLPLTGVFYQLDGTNNSNFPTYNAVLNGSSGSTSAEYVASGEGFYAVVNSTYIYDIYGINWGNTSLSFYEDEKTNTSATGSGALYLAATKSLAASRPLAVSPSKPHYANLHLKLTGNTDQFDECGIYLNKGWSDKFNKLDSRDLDGLAPSVYLSSITADNVRTSINALDDYTSTAAGKRIKLYVRAVTDGIYHLNLEDIANIDTTDYSVYLIDKKLNDSLDMVHYKTYNFNLYTADTASFSNRFLLAIEPKPTPPYNLLSFSGQKGSNTSIQLKWNTVYEGNFTTFGLEKLGTDGNYAAIDSVQSNSSGVYSFNDPSPIMGNNIYRLAQNDIHGKVTFAGPINVNYNTISVSGMFSIYPNPAKDMINISVNSGVTGSRLTPVYQASIYNLSGVAMDSKQVNTNNWTQNISGYKAGVYILELKTTNGDVVGKAKFVKTN